MRSEHLGLRRDELPQTLPGAVGHAILTHGLLLCSSGILQSSHHLDQRRIKRGIWQSASM